MALQIRRAKGWVTALEVADLRHGYDLAWRDAVRLQVAKAGVGGRMWLILDDKLQVERFRVRVGLWVSAVNDLLGRLAQGRRSSVHLFGALTQALREECETRAWGVALSVPGAAHWAHREMLGAPAGRRGEVSTEDIQRNAEELCQGGGSQRAWDEKFRLIGGKGERATLLDACAMRSLL